MKKFEMFLERLDKEDFLEIKGGFADGNGEITEITEINNGTGCGCTGQRINNGNGCNCQTLN